MTWNVVVVGAGGNIGSHLVPHLARMSGVGRLTLIDGDHYAPHNALNQEIGPSAIGKPKALIQARRVRAVNSRLAVTAIADRVERLPLSILRADAVLTGVDTRETRQYVNQAIWRLGVPWIDAGVLADGLLARVSLYVPEDDTACLECGFDESHYATLEQSYPCDGDDQPSYATAAPSSLGALAASLQAIECQKLLSGAPGRLAAGAEVVIDAAHHRHFVTAKRRNPHCRFPDHAPWTIERIDRPPRDLTLRDVFELAERAVPRTEGEHPSAALSVDGKPFARELVCPSCGTGRRLLRLVPALKPSHRRCKGCGAMMNTSWSGQVERLDRAALARRELDRSLHGLGIQRGEIVSVDYENDETEIHMEIGGEAP